MNRDMGAAPEHGELLLFCVVGADQTVCLARRHWFEEGDSKSQTKRLGWKSTWDGSEIPSEWKPFAWATVEHPDPAAA
jgi:hypothetical protein